MPSWTSFESWVISDDDLPSEYYKEFLYGMLQKQKQLKKHVDYEQLINVLAMDKSRLEDELKATKSKLKLYAILSVMFGMQLVKFGCCKCKQIVNTLVAASVRKWLQLQPENDCLQPANACLQMQASIATCKCVLATCKLQLQPENACLQPENACLQPANASLQMQAAIARCK
ncbi:hypothetical protein Tco_1086055 [Tanacetum coccineum]